MTDMLDELLNELAAAPVLLVATDYDGTIAPIVDNPDDARPQRESIVALRMLAALPQTHVAVISGRALADLATLTGLPEDVHLVGSHGSEFDPMFAAELSDEARTLRQRLTDQLTEIADGIEGVSLEHKPASIALHYRLASEDDAKRACDAVDAGPAALSGVYTKRGKMVVELSVVATDKGTALDTVRHRCGASACIFLGDDITDEDAFARLRGPDVAVKVGEGESMAPHRIDDTHAVAQLLATLSERRASWLESDAATPIEQHALLTDQRAIALVTPNGRINWMCTPRPDSPAIFAEILGGAAAGHFCVRPAGTDQPSTQFYDGDTFVLQTHWQHGTLVTDFLDCSGGRPNQRPGRVELVRIIEGDEPMIVEFAPRLDFGRVPTRLLQRTGGLEIEDTHDPIVLCSPGVEWTIHREGMHDVARAEVRPTPDHPVTLEMRYGTGQLRRENGGEHDRTRLTRRYWSAWAEHLTIPDTHAELVRRSALILKGLCHGPTGAVLAAGTTSLPEHIGGVRNWDYRYCWLRDAAMSVGTLTRLGSADEAMSFLNWMCGVVDACESPERLQPLYAVNGAELGTEAEIAELAGYRGSRPVRVGNAASRQVQLDVFGPIVDLIATLLDHDAPLSSEHFRLVEAMVTAVERRWHEPDHGIWEIRKSRRHHVHSKVMCWVTVDRAVRIAEAFLERDMPRWVELRDAIRDDVVDKGFKPSVAAYTAAYDDTDLDAAALVIGLSGLLTPDDERFHSTVNAVNEGLREGMTVYRYRADDGLPGLEGGFHLCTGWLIESFIAIGRMDEAKSLLDALCGLAGPTGMLPEQYDPTMKVSLGNTPQAYSHIAVIQSVLALEAAVTTLS